MQGVTQRFAAVPGVVLTALISALGVLAFGYPFFLSALPAPASTSARAADAPVIFALLMPLLLLLLLAELSSRQMNAKLVAALGVLTALNAVLRLPSGLGDSPTFFFLPVLLGYAYGARFGFLLGALSLFVSALLTVGIGPWLPFQMLAMGWLGMGAAALRWLRPRPNSWIEVLVLAAYAYAACMLFGALMNLYAWPFGVGQSGLGLAAGPFAGRDRQPLLGLLRALGLVGLGCAARGLDVAADCAAWASAAARAATFSCTILLACRCANLNRHVACSAGAAKRWPLPTCAVRAMLSSPRTGAVRAANWIS